MSYFPREIQEYEPLHQLRGRDVHKSEDEARRLSASLPVIIIITCRCKAEGGIFWEERDTLDVHAGECPFVVRKGSPEELGVE